MSGQAFSLKASLFRSFHLFAKIPAIRRNPVYFKIHHKTTLLVRNHEDSIYFGKNEAIKIAFLD